MGLEIYFKTLLQVCKAISPFILSLCPASDCKIIHCCAKENILSPEKLEIKIRDAEI